MKQAVFNKLVEKHYRKNYTHLVQKYRRMTGSLQDAEDIVQEGYCRACMYSDKFDPAKGEFGRWIFRIFTNVSSDFFSKQRVQ